MQLQLLVNGMHCSKCVDKVEKFIGEIEGVSFIDIDLKNAQVKVEFNPPATQQAISEAILEAGFDINENHS